MQIRSQFLAAALAHFALRALNEHIQPRVNPTEPDFIKCWKWTGSSSKPRQRQRMRTRHHWYRGQFHEFIDTKDPERPTFWLNGMDNIDARRVCFELFKPEQGLMHYRLRRLPHCRETLCVNPAHFEAEPLEVNHEKDYPIHIRPESPFSAHLVGSWHPHQQTPSLPPLESPEIGPAVESELLSNAKKSLKVVNPEIKDAFGKVRQAGEFHEETSCPWPVAKNWMSTTSVFVSQVPEPIKSWLAKWPDTESGSFSINGFSPECVHDAFTEVKAAHPAPYALSEILEKENFNFHPKLVLDWYSEVLPFDQRKDINLLK